MTGWLTAPVEELFGTDATAEESYDVLTVDVPPSSWTAALETARSVLGCTYFDWLSAVDEPGAGFRVSAHVVALSPVRRLLVRTTVPHDAPVLPSAVGVYAGAAWHERETHEMFGVTFEGHPGLTPLLLPDGFEGHPLRKDFVLAARVAKAWPGAKEPGESEHGGPKRRQMLPPGVPDPNEWGPLKGQLPAAPARPARGAPRGAGDRPVRRARTASEGSASQTGAGAAAAGAGSPASGAGSPAGPAAPRRSRSVSQGSASQRPAAADGAATDVSAAQADGVHAAGAPARADASGPPRSDDAPWHHARPAFDEAESEATASERPASEPERAASQPEPPVSEPPQSEGAEPAERDEPTQLARPTEHPGNTGSPGLAEQPESPDRPPGNSPDKPGEQPQSPDAPTDNRPGGPQ